MPLKHEHGITQTNPPELEYIVSKREYEEALFAAEEAKRAWSQEHDARIEAEEARDAVMMSIKVALREVDETQNKITKELEETQFKIQKAFHAQQMYEEAMAQAEEVKELLKGACRLLNRGCSIDKSLLRIKEVEERIVHILSTIE